MLASLGGADDHWKAVAEARQATANQAAGLSADEVRKPFVALSLALGALTQHLVDESGLALDPEGDSYYLMLAATVHLPDMLEGMGLTRGAVASYIKTPQAPQLMVGATRLAIDRAALAQVEEDLRHAISFNSDLDRLKLAQGLTGARNYLKAAEAVLKDPAPDAALSASLVKDATVAIKELGQTQRAIAAELDTLLKARANRFVQRTVMGLSVVLVLLAGGLYFFYSFFRVMQSGMKTIVRRMHAMAAGDLTDTLIPKGKDETAILIGALANMQTSLRSIVREVREASESIINAANEVATGSMDLSQRTEQAAANLEETASAMEQIGTTVASTTDGAAKAAGVATDNVNLARQGGQVISQVVGTMSEIQESSRRIGEITGVIDGIAFQTNILALNAAVEAARAGEQGRGFAVVASEVRSLAQRSADAAREIKQLILSSGERVEVGNRIVHEAGTTMKAIVDSTGHVGQLLQAIATGAHEQSSGIAQVGLAINELDQMTQQNAALVEQTAAASSAMRQHAQQLASAVNAFKLPA
ncbi:MAG: hypothetical protein CFE46_09995 [Burkholderiales bacterium PBB6]|nr:MAG: hypothetical protein CFE46_09995 [Burkholderiales bacterium PBB6]